MRILSVTQPWASKIAKGEKKIEYRTWPTNYRGPVLICASASAKGAEAGDPLGCTICIVELTDCKRGEDECWEWHLAKPRHVPHYARKGTLGLRSVDPADTAAVNAIRYASGRLAGRPPSDAPLAPEPKPRKPRKPRPEEIVEI
jgi:hypothetical protein